MPKLKVLHPSSPHIIGRMGRYPIVGGVIEVSMEEADYLLQIPDDFQLVIEAPKNTPAPVQAPSTPPAPAMVTTAPPPAATAPAQAPAPVVPPKVSRRGKGTATGA